VWPEGLCQWKISMTLLEIDPATFWFVTSTTAPPPPLNYISSPYKIVVYSIILNLILSSGFPTQVPRTYVSYARNTRLSSHLLWCGDSTRIVTDCTSNSLSLRNVLQSPVTFSFPVPTIFLSLLYSNSHSLRCSVNKVNQISHTCKTANNVIAVPVTVCLTVCGLKDKREVKRFWPEDNCFS
jgi:hypothetical protein